MKQIVIEQAVYTSREAGGFEPQAHSPGFLDDWQPEVERLCAGFGERPAGVACPGCVFAQPFGKLHVAVVQVADLPGNAGREPGALAFYLLIVPHVAYSKQIGDPFFLAERFPQPWQAGGELPSLSWPLEPPHQRSVAEVQQVLQRSECPSLLGGVQVLVDGGRLVFERPAPDTSLVKSLWKLLPTSTRAELWPASFAFSNALGFHTVVAPRVSDEEYEGYVTEEQAADYPEGSYELRLHMAADAGNQAELDVLFARRSRSQTWRLGLILLVVVGVLAVLGKFLSPKPAPRARHNPAPAVPSPRGTP
jgi:hypothetical protein